MSLRDSLINRVLDPFKRILNTGPPKEELPASTIPNLSDNNQSFKEGTYNLKGKRKSSFGGLEGDTHPEKRLCTEARDNASLSPHEAKRMKIDLIAAKAQITKLEAQVVHQQTLNEEKQILFDEKNVLVAQHNRDKRALYVMKENLQMIRRREKELEDELAQSIKENKKNKRKWDKEKAELQKQIADLKDKLREADVSCKELVSEMKRDIDKSLLALEGARSEVKILKAEVVRQTSRAEQYTTLRTEYEKQTFELQQVTNTLKELEFKRDSYKDWQQQIETAQKRLSTKVELEKEVERLRASEKSLKDSIGNKLLLEEQVHILTAKVETLQPVQEELFKAKEQLSSLESSLEEWKSAARGHGVDTARTLSSALDTGFISQFAATINNYTGQTQLAQLSEELITIKNERDTATTKLNDLVSVRENLDSLILRLHKRLVLFTRERNTYRQQIDCYEKELLSGVAGEGRAALVSARVEELEKLLQSYRDLLALHDQQEQIKMVEDLRAEVTKWREEAESLRCDVTKLRAKRDTLQAYIHRFLARLSAQTKLLDPAENQSTVQLHLKSAQEEIKGLKTALRESGSGGAPNEMQQIRKQLKNCRTKLKRMKKESTSAQEYRDIVYMLLGYKIDKTGRKKYRLSSMYTQSPKEDLTLTLCYDTDTAEIVYRSLSPALTKLVDLHLRRHQSIPMFMSAVTMDLFTQSNIQRAE